MSSHRKFWLAIALQVVTALALHISYSGHGLFRFGGELGEALRAPSEVAVVTASPVEAESAAAANARAAATAAAEAAARVNMRVTPLMEAAGNGMCDEVARLITEGAPVNTPNAKGTTALIYAASAGLVLCIKQLIAAGANVRQVDLDGDSAISAAKQQGFTEIVSLLEAASR